MKLFSTMVIKIFPSSLININIYKRFMMVCVSSVDILLSKSVLISCLVNIKSLNVIPSVRKTSLVSLGEVRKYDIIVSSLDWLRIPCLLANTRCWLFKGYFLQVNFWVKKLTRLYISSNFSPSFCSTYVK